MAILSDRRSGRFQAALRTFAALATAIVLYATALPARAAFNITTPRGTFAGTHNYVVTGGTLRAASNDSNACSLNSSSTAALSGIPSGSTILKAYLYWGGSGPTVDSQVTFGPTGSTSTVNADQTFTEGFVLSGSYDLSFFGGFKDVTSQVAGNGNYSFSGLSVASADNVGNSLGDYCTSQTVLAAWSLVVVYSNPSERYRFTRVYDGLQYFRGSSVTTVQSGFRVPDLVDGKVTVVSWEGDPDATTSTELDGYNETLKFEGNLLSNAGCDATNNLYNSTMKSPGGSCVSTNYGADVDTYDVTPFLYEGQTGATLEYASGNDLVLLAAQVISTTNTPVADLDITKTHNGSYFTAGENGSYNIVVHNEGPEIATGTATVTDTLPTGFTFVSGTGTGWSCSAVGQVVTCNNSAPSIAIGANLPALTLTVAVDGTAAASTQNTANVSHPMFDGTGGNNSSTDTVTVRRSNLSTSTKTVTDVNGGTVQPGDTLRYTVMLTAASGTNIIDATGVSVVDDLAANLGGLQIVSIPAGATDNSIGSGGANGTGQVNVTGITVPAGTSRTIVFDVVVSNDAAPGDHIDNSATITNPSGPGATPSAPQQTIPDPAPPSNGNKVLYLYDNTEVPNRSLTRTPQLTTSTSNYVIVAGNNSQTWPLAGPVATGKSLTLPAQTITAYLFTRAGNNNTGTTRGTTVSLLHGSTVIATSDNVNVSGTGVTRRQYNITIPSGGYTFTSGDNLSLRFNNDGSTTHAANREVWVYGRSTGTGATVCVTLANCSKLILGTSTVVNVDGVEMYSAAYPATTQKAEYEAGDHVFIRADISDPFGGYDVSGATLSLKDGNNATVLTNQAMTAQTSPAYNSGTPNRIFEYEYIIPASPNYGDFTATVTGAEGSEGTITHTRPNTFTVVPTTAPPSTGNKVLYVYDNQLASPNPRQQVTRTPQPTATTGTNYIIVAGSNNKTWPLTGTVATGKSLILPAQTIPVYLYTRTGNNSLTTNRPTTVALYNGGTLLGTSTSQNVGGTDGATITRRQYNVAIPATTIAAGGNLTLRYNITSGAANREVWVYGNTTGNGATVCVTLANCSKLTFNTSTVINVDSVEMYTAAYPATTQKAEYRAGDHVFIRASISDPFGGYDVSGATLLLKDGSNTTVVPGTTAMTAKTSPAYDSGTPNRIFEYDYTIPANPNYGTFTATVTGAEGSEGTVTHSRANTFVAERQALDIVKSHSGDFTAGVNNSYTLTVNNGGNTTVTGTTTVKDTLAPGLTFVSGTGTGWTCSAAGQVVTCTSTASISASSSMAPITLTVLVAGNMGSSVANQASVGNSIIASGQQNPGNTDTALIRHPDLSTSTKTVTDLNGGDANPGDTLRYTITVKESAGYPASGVTVTDVFPASLTGITGINVSLSTCSGTPSMGGNTLTVTGLSVAGGGSCTLVVDAQVSASAGAGLTIDNAATIDNPGGPGATPSAPTVTVSQSQIVIPGGKILYVYANNSMTRVAQTGNASNTINESSYQDFTLGAVANPLTIAPGSTISMDLWLLRSGNTTTTPRTVYVKLFKNGSTQIGAASNSVTFDSTTAARQNFTITAPSFGSAGNLQPGDTLLMRVYNDSGTGGNPRTVGFSQRVTGGSTDDDLSTLTISTPTVVHVDSVAVHSAAWPSTSQAAGYGQGDTIYIRATVSDPFGYADISGGSIEIKNPSGTTVQTANLTNATHSKSTSGATRVYEYAYTIPASPPIGAWTASVTANEGSEGTITHTGNSGFGVGGRVTLRKTWGGGANAGDAVSLTITGGTGATAGSSTAPSTLTAATSNAVTGATITLTEAFTTGVAGNYTITLACEKDSDHTTVTPSGTGLSRTIVMPAASVTCTYTNSKTVPLTVVKVATVYSDPVNGTTNPKAIPGAVVEYQIIVTNPAATPADSGTVFIRDVVPAGMELRVADIAGSGSGPVQFIDGSPSSGLTYTPGSDVAFSNDGGSTWTYTPSAGPDGTDPAVTVLRVNPKGAFNANNAQFTIKVRMRLR